MRKYKINLLKEKEVDMGKKITFFLYHYLRYVIIITATIVIGVFFYRYLIDQQVIDLKEQVNEKQEIINVTKPLVAKVEEISKKIGEINTRLVDQDNFSANIRYALSVIPEKIILTDFKFESKRILIGGISADYTTVRILQYKLSREVVYNSRNIKYKKVTIDKIIKGTQGFEFAISILI